jgi:hypothetical protein
MRALGRFTAIGTGGVRREENRGKITNTSMGSLSQSVGYKWIVIDELRPIIELLCEFIIGAQENTTPPRVDTHRLVLITSFAGVLIPFKNTDQVQRNHSINTLLGTDRTRRDHSTCSIQAHSTPSQLRTV